MTPALRHRVEAVDGQARAGVVTTVVPESDTKRNIDRAYAALADYIERRVSDMERYNSAFE